MKGKLLFTFALVSGIQVFAASPYQGSEAAEGKYYLYQVESNQWLQPNFTQLDNWTTHSELGQVGFEVELRKLDGFEGFQIYCDFTNNGELNGSDEDRFYLDQPDRALCDWIFEPANVDGVSNGYKIMIKAKPDAGVRDRIDHDTYIGYTEGRDFGGLSDADLTGSTWQLVSRESRLNWMQEEVANGPVDASWLIPWFDQGRNDHRSELWRKDIQNPEGGGVGFDGSLGYPVQEGWHHVTLIQSITLTDLPSGTYGFSVQAFYRDTEIESAELGQRYLDGTENLDRVNYFAGANKANVMSIFADAKEEQGNGFEYYHPVVGKYVPNSMGDASRAMINGAYVNEFIEAPVNDGNLYIGIEKTSGDYRDWIIYKRFYLQYLSTQAGAEDLSGLQADLQALITEAEAYSPSTSLLENAVNAAKEVLENATTSTELNEGISALQAVFTKIKNSSKDINDYLATVALGVSDEQADAQFEAGEYGTAIRTLRYARRRAAADTQADVFEGNEPADGKFYLYNVGQKQFLCGGSDWGAHAALGMPGIELSFEKCGEKDGYAKYLIETGLYNGDGNDFLNYRGYMDTPKGDNGGFAFIPVEGKTGVYYMVQGDYQDVHVAWNPYASVDGGMNDETNVGTEERNLDPANLNAQWKLVTRAEREALMEEASEENPVDVSFLIQKPNFSQRENGDAWYKRNFGIFGEGANFYDFIAESWNSDSAELYQEVELPAGVYVVGVQGYYRNSAHSKGEVEGQALGVANVPEDQNAFFYVGNDQDNDVALPYILEESGMAPGEGDDAVSEDGERVYNIPNSALQATHFFKSGLYKVSTKVEHEGGDLQFGIYKNVKGDAGDWVVVDNFRISYLGALESEEDPNTPEEPKEDDDNPTGGVDSISVDVNAPVYNLHGVRVNENNLTPGIYIKNGKKIIVK